MNVRKLLLPLLFLLSACTGRTVYFGTYSGEVFRCTLQGGTLKNLRPVARMENPSYLALDGCDLYAVSETDSAASLNLLGSVSSPTMSAGPCHVSVGHGLSLVSNYSGGSLSVFRLPLDGTPPFCSVKGSVGGPDSVRQCTPHVHCAVFSPDGTHALVSDFSADRLLSLSVSNDTVILERVYNLPPDTGPRHILFANNNIVYVIGELSGNICVLSYPDGRILQIAEADPAHTRASADIRISPDGKYLYASNRLGMDGVAIFKILPDGTLRTIGYTRTAACPRNIAISPDGRFLLVASQTENIVEVYPLDPASGLPGTRISTLSVPSPVCILFAD